MTPQQHAFLQLVTQHHILRFGEFTLKSGRVSPYFFNAGLFDSGRLLADLATHYAALITKNLPGEFMLFGPAYKGIPLAAATAVQLAEKHECDVAYAYNRKEAKDHGEGGVIVGAPLAGNVVIIDDVMTAGTSVRESVALINEAGAKLAAVVIAVDRQEYAGDDGLSAVQSVSLEYAVPVYSIVNLDAIIAYAQKTGSEAVPNLAAVEAYRQKYGVNA